jgi:hypothetical protein
MATNYLAFQSVTVTVPNDAAVHSLRTLLVAIDPISPIRTKWITMQVNASSAGTLLIGGAATDDQGVASPSALTATNYGISLAPGAPVEYWYGVADEAFPLSRFFVMASGGVATVHVQVFRG